MITVKYLPNIHETINVTMDFLNRRPVVKIMLILTKVCCFLMCIAYILKATINTLKFHDMLVLLFALTWLFGYRFLNALILKKVLIKNKTDKFNHTFHINKDKLWGTNNNTFPIQQQWKQVKYIYKNHNGYIIPAIGSANAGKFVWLPKRGFDNTDAENNFLEILQQHKILVK